MNSRVIRHLPLGVAAIVALAACEGERTNITDVVGEPSYDFRFTAGSQRGLPRTGLLDAVFLGLAAFDTTVPDAWARSGDLVTRLLTASLPTVGTTGWNLRSTIRRFSVDGRAPVMSGTRSYASDLLTLEGPDVAGGMWRLSLRAWDLTPDATYAIAFARYGLVQVDSLDHNAVLNTGSNFPALVRDTLKLLGGTPGAVAAGGCQGATAVTLTSGTNPFVVGTFTAVSDPYGIGSGFTGYDANADAAVHIQRCILDPSGLWYRATAVDLSRTPIAPNSGVTFNLPQYNYIIVYDVATGTQVFRAQIGQDIRFSDGAPINNAFAPMPCRVAPQDFYFTNFFTGNTRTLCNFSATTDVRTTRQKISAPGGEGRVDTVRVSFRGLKSVGSGVYQAWLINPATGATPVAAVGRLRAFRVDTITDVPVLDTDTTLMDSGSTRSSFSGYDMPQAAHLTYTLNLTNASTGVSLRDYTHVMLSVEAAAGATAPSSRTAVWARYGDQRGTATDYKDDEWVDKPAASWGNITATGGATYVFTPAGRGLGGFRAEELSVDVNDLARPPIGYYYKAWLVDVNSGPNGTDTVYVAVDTLRSPFPARSLLFNADSTEAEDPSVVLATPHVITGGQFRNLASAMGLDVNQACNPQDPTRGTCPFFHFEQFMITLEPKGSDAALPGPSVVFVASVPSIVRSGRP